MAGGKETPRQKMIGMMYLVLTALLALNVSKEILNAFVVVNEGLQNTNINFQNKNQTTYSAFAKLMSDPQYQAKAKPFNERAQKVKKMCDELNKHILDLKKELIKETDKTDEKGADTLVEKMMSIASKDNYDIPTHLMIGDDLGTLKSGKWTAKELREKIETLKKNLIALLAEGTDGFKLLPEEKKKLTTIIDKSLKTDNTAMENGVKVGWEGINFYHLPLVAVLTNL